MFYRNSTSHWSKAPRPHPLHLICIIGIGWPTMSLGGSGCLNRMSSLYMKFYNMEDTGKVQADDDLHRFALHTVFLPFISQKLSSFATAWNMHRLRTAHKTTPNQL